MFQSVFEGVYFSYYYEIETDQYLLFNKENNTHIVLKGDDAFMFKEHLALINIERDNTLNERIEKVIEIHYNFSTKPCPMPYFVE
ncbi:hypothetical protein [Treponema sp. R80B11-R83G3]